MKYWLFLLLMLGSFGINGQSFKAYQKAAEKAFAEQDYYSALHYWRSALERKPKAVDAWYQYANAARLFYAFEVAKDAYEKVLKYRTAGTYAATNYYLGLVLKGLGQYEEALLAFRDYEAENGPKEFEKILPFHIEACQGAKQKLAAAVTHTVTPLSKRINTAYSDFGAWQQADTLYFSSYRFENKKDKTVPKRKIAKILYTTASGRGRVIRTLNSDTLHTAHTSLSLDGSRLYYTLCRYQEGGGITCELYYRKKARRNRWGTRAYRLPAPVNLAKYTATHPAIGYDSTLQAEVLYFVSDRPSGQGGFDIWWSKVAQGENQFSEPQAFSGNTSFDEITPFISSRSQHIYYSADYPEGLGGFDIYSQSLDPEKATTRSALPAPINGSYNDLYFTSQNGMQSGYFSSNRPGEKYLDALSKSCCNDLYQFAEIPRPPVPTTDSLVVVQNKPSTPIPPILPPPLNLRDTLPSLAVPTELSAFLPLALYFDNDQPDPRTRRRSTKQDYLSTYEPYLVAEDIYLSEYSSLFSTQEQAAAEERMLNFFEEDIRFGAERLKQFSALLLERLALGDQVEIFVKGYTSPRAKSDYNLLLGKRRVSSLINHFKSYQGGIFLPYLKREQLIISEKSFGETTAAEDISDDIGDIRRSVYSIGAARERRVEIVEVKRN